MLAGHDALLLVDVQRDFLPGGALAVPRGDEIVPVLAACIQKFTDRRLPVYASRDWHPVDHCSFRVSGGEWPVHCVAGSAGARFDAALELPADVTIVSKAQSADRDAYSAFDGTELHSLLTERGVQRLFVGGLATDFCVRHTARDALRHGYNVSILEDAVRAIDPAGGKQAIDELRQLGAVVTRSGEILDE